MLVCVSVSVASIFLFAFVWAVKSGQFDDCHTPAIKMLFEDKPFPSIIQNQDS